ncbi:DUF6221 family protein [Streptomyces sp. NPDC093707]|uniref:DUF6221 family protein n=1 Tax=Streptomyces sp. NPDC093707 TaxID=3154984 RepID=UPI0034508F8D
MGPGSRGWCGAGGQVRPQADLRSGGAPGVPGGSGCGGRRPVPGRRPGGPLRLLALRYAGHPGYRDAWRR